MAIHDLPETRPAKFLAETSHKVEGAIFIGKKIGETPYCQLGEQEIERSQFQATGV